jgi:hypothetical protein
MIGDTCVFVTNLASDVNCMYTFNIFGNINQNSRSEERGIVRKCCSTCIASDREKEGGPDGPPGVLIYFFFGFAAFLAGAFFALGFPGAALPAAAAFNSAPAENLGTFLAAILISLPVWGFLPFLAFLSATRNVPKPTRVALPPARIVWVMESVITASAFAAAVLEILISSATFATISAFVILNFLLVSNMYIYGYQAQKLYLLSEPL